ncbi:hypothetical protein CABS01_16862 [Colletotrichum abscissum]|uniref:uncharacterized protein n=1 Tax=Colletotrichum abscissum TaxID=1671311 RepID=UPI0027D59763|nr:uncharacterized protein CABS01_16862 [Colletotrichum abscissum]KAK1508142.1 hypothetical protein CABS01_16862 [Colletotrichum abscissum]
MAVWYAERKCGEFARNVSQVTLSKKIYVRYAYFEGTRYIARLTNAATNNRDILLFDPLSQTPAVRLYVSSDHLGIRQLLFVNSSSKPAIIQEPDVWWKTICLGSLGRFIRTRGDGSKMRVIAGESLQLPQVAWGLPQAVYKHLRLEPLCNAELTYRMSVVPCNHPTTTAYSLCWNQSILTLHAHTTGENFDFYHELRTMDESALWFYMPLRVDEVVTEIWKCDGSLRSAIALLLVTDQGRSTCLGVQPRPHWSRSKWTHEYYAWNRARLKDVVEIAPCRRQRMGKSILIGLLLRYADGTSACVGQIRLDSLQRAVNIDPTSTLWERHLGQRTTNCIRLRKLV